MVAENIAGYLYGVNMTKDEPVAYFNPQENGFYWAKPTKIEAPVTVDVEPLPLYTAPQGCAECGVGGGYALYCLVCSEKFVGNKEWVGLTRSEVLDIVDSTTHPLEFYRAIEAKLKDKNI